MWVNEEVWRVPFCVMLVAIIYMHQRRDLCFPVSFLGIQSAQHTQQSPVESLADSIFH